MKFFYAIKAAALALVATVALTGCSFETIPPAYKGKILTTTGYNPEILEPGKLTTWGRDKLILLETGTRTVTETITVKMQDKLDLTFDVRMRTRIGGSDKALNGMFNDIQVKDSIVSLPQIYSVYGLDVVQSTARSIVGKYNTEDVAANFDKITSELQERLVKNMANSPLEVSNVTLGNLQYPKVITDAIEKQSERKLAIETETNQQAIEAVKRENQLKLAQMDQDIELTKARTLRDANQITANGLTPMLLSYRALEVQEKMAENNNAIFVPYEAMGTSGLSNRIFAK
uniref:SPFH domain protein n=1 Tax=Pseudomonas phage RVTF4 TaxID=3236931 RepID=A0AB39CCC5_9VIRU